MSKIFKKRLNEMFKDEKKAPYDYSKLIKSTNDPSIKKKLRRIQSQEKNHRKIIGEIKRRLK
jgi:rubrerythrin